jgi:hypothetical protein
LRIERAREADQTSLQRAPAQEVDMRASEPSPGDFVVEYRHLSHGRGAARVAVVHLTMDAGPEELFTSNAARSGERAENLATIWAFEDGTRAWRLMWGDGDRATLQPIGIDARLPRPLGGVMESVLPAR